MISGNVFQPIQTQPYSQLSYVTNYDLLYITFKWTQYSQSVTQNIYKCEKNCIFMLVIEFFITLCINQMIILLGMFIPHWLCVSSIGYL